MATSLATARGNVYTTLSTAFSTNANAYKRRQKNYQYPCFVVGWPQEFDVRPTQGGNERDFVLNVWVACESIDDESTDDALSAMLETAVTALMTNSAWDVQPAFAFNEEALDDQRSIVSCLLPVAVLA